MRTSEAQARACAEEVSAFMEYIPALTFMSYDPECRHVSGSKATRQLLRMPGDASPDNEENVTFTHMSIPQDLKKVTIHTDGACDGNPGPGGWAVVLRYGAHMREIAGGEAATTNNRMEIQAAIAGLAALKESCAVTLFTDSEYLRQGITKWLARWRVNKWRTIDRKPVKNADLWRQLDEVSSKHQVKWEWLKGHSGNVDNERCDFLSRAEVAKIRRRHSPEQLKTLRKTFITNRDSDRIQDALF